MTRPAVRLALLVFPVSGMLFSGSAWSQAVPTPGAVQEQLRQPPAMPATPQGTVRAPAAPSATAGVAPGGQEILVQRFDITGNMAIPSEELHDVVAPYEGRMLTLFEIYDVADLLTRYYRTHGYTLASATVPAQQVASGVVSLEVIEGKLGKVTTEGNHHTKSSFLAWQMRDLKPGDVIRDKPLEREILLLNDLPGVDARAVLQPGEEFGTSDLVVQTKEKWLEGSVGIDNHGRESIGEWRALGSAALNGVLGYGDRLDVSAVYAEADLLHYGRIAYSVPVSPWGTRASVYYSSYDYEVNAKKLGKGLESLDIDGEGDNFGVNVLHPFWRSQTTNLFLGVGFDRTVTHQDESTFGISSNGDIGLGVFSALFNYLGTDGSFSTLGAAVSTNFNRNERDPLTRAVENNAQTAKLQLDMSHYRAIAGPLALLARFTGVASVDPLVDTQQFRLGGSNSVRAYASSELSGDSGFFASTEFQYALNSVPGLEGQAFKAFLDTGRVYRKNHNLLGVEHSESLSGVGLGYQAFVLGHLSIDAAVAYPIGQHESSDDMDGVRAWAALSASF